MSRFNSLWDIFLKLLDGFSKSTGLKTTIHEFKIDNQSSEYEEKCFIFFSFYWDVDRRRKKKIHRFEPFTESVNSKLEEIVLAEFQPMISEYNIKPKSESLDGDESYLISSDNNTVTLEIFKSQNSIEWQKIKNGRPKYMSYIFDLRLFIDKLEEMGFEVDENKNSHKHKILTLSKK